MSDSAVAAANTVSMDACNIPHQVALVLSGGGARAAYQVGVMKAIGEILPANCANPFPIICGTSAGAINAAMLATQADHFTQGVKQLEQVWRSLHAEKVVHVGYVGACQQFGDYYSLFSAVAFSVDHCPCLTICRCTICCLKILIFSIAGID
ncbi:MAG: patatin-like phospholipase family protein [Pseudomonadales bacterium]